MRKQKERVNPFKPKLYKGFVDDIINRRRKDQPDQLFQKFNNNHLNVNYAVLVSSEMFLDTKAIY